MNQNQVRNQNHFVTGYANIWSDFILVMSRIQKKYQKFNFHYMEMSMLVSYISKFVDFTKAQKSQYLENETFFFQIKYLIHHTSNTTLRQKKHFVIEVTFKLPWNLRKLYWVCLLQWGLAVNLKFKEVWFDEINYFMFRLRKVIVKMCYLFRVF